ncbi:MAG TPA: methyltransferase domain-containing protein [Puia sp.]|nr:methyltransferase domain-containing protein [Puia sp.]
MPWNPDQYNRFKEDRYKPFYDLISHIADKPDMDIVDLGCGTGELTQVLADRFSASSVLGIDNSPEMLSKAKNDGRVSFQLKSIEDQLQEPETWDLILANASLQWTDDHPTLFNRLIGKLNNDGQLAVQMPSQTENLLNRILLGLVQETPYREALHGWVRHSPVLTLDEYTNILFSNGGRDLAIYQKVYPIVAQSPDELYAFIAGSALIPYMEHLDPSMQKELESEFRRRIAKEFPNHPAVYAFKRLVLYARF